MSVNKYLPHLYVIPEDRRNEQIANGFTQHPSVKTRQVQVVEPAGGWTRVLETFKDEYQSLVLSNTLAHVVMLIDFDGNPIERRARFAAEIPPEIQERVFLMGTLATPEDFKRMVNKSFEEIGWALADDCARDSDEMWRHEHLKHNEIERLRLINVAKPFLFS